MAYLAEHFILSEDLVSSTQSLRVSIIHGNRGSLFSGGAALSHLFLFLCLSLRREGGKVEREEEGSPAGAVGYWSKKKKNPQ